MDEQIHFISLRLFSHCVAGGAYGREWRDGAIYIEGDRSVEFFIMFFVPLFLLSSREGILLV
jgi:hypothetical protein